MGSTRSVDTRESPSELVADSGSLTPGERIAPSWTTPVVQLVSRIVGGPLGRHAQIGRQWFFTPLRVILLLAVVLLALGWLAKAPCLATYESSQGPMIDWRDNKQYVALCYTDIIPRYSAGDLSTPGSFPYKTPWTSQSDSEQAADGQQRYMEYPVITGLFQWWNATLAAGWAGLAQLGLLPGGATDVIYFDLTALWLAAFWLVTVWAVFRLSASRPWDAALVAVSPLALVHVFTNFDALAAALAMGGLLAWARQRPAVAGLLLGLGAAAKLYPILLLIPLVMLGIRAGRPRPVAQTLGAAAAGWLAVNLPILLAFPRGWSEFLRLNTTRAADPDSLYNVVAHFTGWSGFDGPLPAGQAPVVLNAVSAALFLACCAGIAWLALVAPVPPRVASLCFLVVAAFLLTNKVWSPQFSLWLVPLAVLAIPRWRLLLVWMSIDAALWGPRMYYYLGIAHQGIPEGWFLGAVLVRDAVVILLCVLVVRHMLRPGSDPVRVAHDSGLVNSAHGDPLAGVLIGRDRFVLPGFLRFGTVPRR